MTGHGAGGRPGGVTGGDAGDVVPGDLVFLAVTSRLDVDRTALEGFAPAGAEVLFVVETDASSVLAVQLGVMSDEAAVTHLPEWADMMTVPKVLFIGGDREPVLIGVGLVREGTNPYDPRRLGRPAEVGVEPPAGGAFMHVKTGHSPAEYRDSITALRVFHSYVRVSRAELRALGRVGSVAVTPALPDDVFGDRPWETWRRIQRRQPYPALLWSTWAEHPDRN